MSSIRLTEATWKERELARVRSTLLHHLDRTGVPEAALARLLKRYLGVDYTAQQLGWFRDQLVTEGMIEVL